MNEVVEVSLKDKQMAVAKRILDTVLARLEEEKKQAKKKILM